MLSQCTKHWLRFLFFFFFFSLNLPKAIHTSAIILKLMIFSYDEKGGWEYNMDAKGNFPLHCKMEWQSNKEKKDEKYKQLFASQVHPPSYPSYFCHYVARFENPNASKFCISSFTSSLAYFKSSPETQIITDKISNDIKNKKWPLTVSKQCIVRSKRDNAEWMLHNADVKIKQVV